MGTLKEKLDYLEATKLEIKNALIEKGVSINDKDTFRSYANKIKEIESSSFIMPQGMIFKDSTMTEIPMMDTSNITDMSSVFENCVNLVTIPNLNFINAENMHRTFYNCRSLVNVPKIDCYQTLNMDYAFYGCSSLKKIESIDFSFVDNIDNIFTNADNIIHLNIIGLGTSDNILRIDFSNLSQWGVSSNEYPDARNSLFNSLNNNICDRTKFGIQQKVTIVLHPNVVKSLNDIIKNNLTAKGYIIETAKI